MAEFYGGFVEKREMPAAKAELRIFLPEHIAVNPACLYDVDELRASELVLKHQPIRPAGWRVLTVRPAPFGRVSEGGIMELAEKSMPVATFAEALLGYSRAYDADFGRVLEQGWHLVKLGDGKPVFVAFGSGVLIPKLHIVDHEVHGLKVLHTQPVNAGERVSPPFGM